MKADSRARFLPMFAKLASERVERMRVLAANASWSAVAAELHALAGEAALLELRPIADLARRGEGIARKGESPAAECERVLRELAEQIASISLA